MLRWLLAIPGIALMLAAGTLVIRPDAHADDLRAADALWQSGQIYEARRAFLALRSGPDVAPIVVVRLAAIDLLRGDCTQAQIHAATGLQAGDRLRRDEAALLHLIAGRCAALRDDAERATAEWQSIDPRSPLLPIVTLLRGEQALRQGAEADAVTLFRSALDEPLPDAWIAFARVRLALLLAPESPDQARALLAEIRSSLAFDADTRALLPIDPPTIVGSARQLAAILDGDVASQPIMLAQYARDLGLIRIALRWFERVPIDGPSGVLAQANAAFMRWTLGQRAAALAQLRELAIAAPQQPVAATLFAAVAAEVGDLDAAQAALDTTQVYAPVDPAIALARSDLLAARREYPQAIQARGHARDLAAPAERGRYALALADLHLRLAYDVCGGGLAAARDAASSAPDDPAAWRTLAEVQVACGVYVEATESARAGLQHAPDDPGLLFLLGESLWESGDRAAARGALIRAIDVAPASVWRQRAETLLDG